MNVGDQTPLEPGPEAVLQGGQLLGRPIGGDDDLLVRVVQRVEGVEELLLDAFLALDELDVVDEQYVDVAITALERRLAVVAQRVDEVVGELLGGDVLDAHAGKEPLRVVARRVQEVCLAEPGLTPDEERVVGTRRRLGDGEAGRVGEPVGGTDDEGVERVPAVEADVVGRRAVLRLPGEVTRPALLGAGERFLVLVDLVGIGQGVVAEVAVRVRTRG